MRRSRLSKKAEKKSMQTIFLSFLGIAVIIFLLLRYGIPLISEFSFFAGQIIPNSSDKNENTDKNDAYVPVPDIDSLPKATKEQNINITGTSLSGLTVYLYLNGSKDDEMEVVEDGTFEFSVKLTEGENIIKAKAIKDKNESEFSDSTVVVYKKSGPELSLESPEDGSEVKNSPVEVKGKTDPDSIVTVNDFQAIINSEGNWSYFLSLKQGDNEVKIISVDLAGNKTEKTVHFNFAP